MGSGSSIWDNKGFVGLTLLYMAMVLPAALFIWRFPPRLWADPRLAAGSLTAVLLGLYIIDCLLNAFPNMIYIVLAGGLMGLEPGQLYRPGRTTITDWGGPSRPRGVLTRRRPSGYPR